MPDYILKLNTINFSLLNFSMKSLFSMKVLVSSRKDRKTLILWKLYTNKCLFTNFVFTCQLRNANQNNATLKLLLNTNSSSKSTQEEDFHSHFS